MVFLLVKVCLNEHMDLVGPGPVPVQCVLAKGGDVCHVEAHGFLGESCLLGWCAAQWWVVSGGGKAWLSGGVLPGPMSGDPIPARFGRQSEVSKR